MTAQIFDTDGRSRSERRRQELDGRAIVRRVVRPRTGQSRLLTSHLLTPRAEHTARVTPGFLPVPDAAVLGSGCRDGTLLQHRPRDGVRQHLEQGEACRTAGSGIDARPRSVLELPRPLERHGRDVKRAEGTVARPADGRGRRRHRRDGKSHDRTRLAIRRRMVMVRPESSQTDVNTRASRIRRSA